MISVVIKDLFGPQEIFRLPNTVSSKGMTELGGNKIDI